MWVIRKKYADWHKRRAREFWASQSGVPETMPTEKNVEDYFESFLQKGFLKPWQFIQIVDAVCYLLRDAFKLDWAVNFDW